MRKLLVLLLLSGCAEPVGPAGMAADTDMAMGAGMIGLMVALGLIALAVSGGRKK